MTGFQSRRAFIAFHLALGLALLYLSVRTVLTALADHADHSGVHVVLASVETLGALLFLFARTLRLGGILLLATMGVAALVHAMQMQLRADLIVYCAGTVFVMAHGSAWRTAQVTDGGRVREFV
jgi:hypothetical protein